MSDTEHCDLEITLYCGYQMMAMKSLYNECCSANMLCCGLPELSTEVLCGL